MKPHAPTPPPDGVLSDYEVAAAWVLHEMNAAGGMEPGAFTAKLIDAAMSADTENMRRVSRGWPAIGWAVHVWRFERDGLDLLVAAALGEWA